MSHRWDPIAAPVGPLTWPVAVDPAGRAGPTPNAARGPRWRRTSAGAFVPVTVSDEVVEQRIVEQYARTSGRAVLTGWAALRLHGANFFDGLARDGQSRLPVPIATNGERPAPGPAYVRMRLTVPPDEVALVHGIRCASVERALFDEMRLRGGAREMSVAADMVFAARLTSLSTMKLYSWDRRWYRDVRLVREALEMSVEESRSPQESRFRHIWEYDVGWGRPLCNRPVLDQHGRLVAVPDLLDPERGVAGEYAGADHRDRDRHASDVRRTAALHRVGLQVAEVVGADLISALAVADRMREAEQRARASSLPRLWTLGPSPSRDAESW